MKKTFFLLASVALISSAHADTGTVIVFDDYEHTYADYSAHDIVYTNNTNFEPNTSNTLALRGNDTLAFSRRNDRPYVHVMSLTHNWTNDLALAEMNSTLGTNVPNFQNLAYAYANNYESSLLFNLGSDDLGKDATFYLLTGTTLSDPSIDQFNVAGLTDVSISWAYTGGSGFTSSTNLEILDSLQMAWTPDKTFSNVTRANDGWKGGEYILFKVTGTVDSEGTGEVAFSSIYRNVWGMAAYNVVPEPATVSLNLFGLAALMLRRRRA